MAPHRITRTVAAGGLALALGLAGAARSPAQEAAGFVGGVEDLPLMEGLSEVSEARVVFDKPAGRIVDAFAVGEVAAARVRDFYAAALPQLGWQRRDDHTYQREGERLTIDISEDGAAVTVRFSISPL